MEHDILDNEHSLIADLRFLFPRFDLSWFDAVDFSLKLGIFFIIRSE